MTLKTAGHLTVNMGGDPGAVLLLSNVKELLHIRHIFDKIFL